MKASKLSQFKLHYEYREDLEEINERIDNYRDRLKQKFHQELIDYLCRLCYYKSIIKRKG